MKHAKAFFTFVYEYPAIDVSCVVFQGIFLLYSNSIDFNFMLIAYVAF